MIYQSICEKLKQIIIFLIVFSIFIKTQLLAFSTNVCICFIFRMFDSLHLAAGLLLLITTTTAWRPCPELSSALRFPCRCKVEPFGPKQQLGAVAMDCDYVVFQTESPIIPNGAPIISYSQRYSGQQVLPTQVNIVLVLLHFRIKLKFYHFYL